MPRSKSVLLELASRLSPEACRTPLDAMVRSLPAAVWRDIQLGAKTDQTVGELLEEDPDFAHYFAWEMRSPARRRFVGAIEVWAKQAAKPPSEIRAWEGGPALTATGLRAFAVEQGLASELQKPLEVAAGSTDQDTWWRLSYLADRSIESVLASGPSRSALQVIAAYLRHTVRRPHEVAARNDLIARGAASPALEALSLRIRARLTALAFPEPPPEIPIEHLRFFVDPDAIELVMEDPYHFSRPKVSLSLLEEDEQGAVVHSDFRREERQLLRVLLEHSLDVIHDATHPLHAELRRVLEAPQWERLLEKLRAVTVEPAPRIESEARVVWRIEERGGHHFVDALVQKRTKRGWSPGSATPPDRLRASAELDVHDERVLSAFVGRPYMYRPIDEKSIAIFEALAGHPRVLHQSEHVQVRTYVPELAILEEGEELMLALRVGDELLSAGEAVKAFIPGPGLVRVHAEESEVRVARVDPTIHAMITAAARHATPIPVSATDELLALLKRLPEGVGLELPPSLAGVRVDASGPLVLQLDPLPAAGLRAHIVARPLGRGPQHPPGEGPVHLVGVLDGVRSHTVRDLARERHAADSLAVTLGLDRAVHEGSFTYRVDAADDAVALLETLAANPGLAIVEWPDGAMAWRVGRLDSANFVISLRKAAHWFEVSTEVEIDEQRVELAKILVALRQRRRYVQIGKGRFVRIADELRAQLESLDPVLHVAKGEVHAGGEAIAMLEATLERAQIDGDASWKELSERLKESRTLARPMPEGLTAELRDYQVAGVEWLLRTTGWARGACLADEMGLGKTVQTIALLLSRASEGPSLVVGPTSITDNWRRELERFAPSLRAIVYRGANRREKLEDLGPNDVLIASYDVIARDVDVLTPIQLSTLVLDEAQAIKNPTALRTRAVRSLSASVKVALTGTPIENRLSELWSLFAILAPGLFDTWEEFRARFAVPIEKQGDEKKLAELREMLRPFLLRRTKAMVARELPPRVEVVRPVDLSEEERALYEAERAAALSAIENRRGDPDFRFVILGMLTRLRRLVCDPSLVFEDSTVKSSKIEELIALLDDLRREEHRALVFSQFTTLLARVRRALDARRVPYLYLDGSTPATQRIDLVDRWQEGSDPFFLISLKAGGTGLNLTAADYVVHLDPWWNPAVEDQASDRAHRIGQTKPVTVVRLVATATIEERVLELHESKRRLASGLLEGAEANAAIDTDALIDLLGEGQRARTKWRRASGRGA